MLNKGSPAGACFAALPLIPLRTAVPRPPLQARLRLAKPIRASGCAWKTAPPAVPCSALGSMQAVMHMLEAIRTTGLERSARFYQASTSELYGKVHEVPQSEETPFHPRSPYGVAKLYGFWAVKNYRRGLRPHHCHAILSAVLTAREGAIARTWLAARSGRSLVLPSHNDRRRTAEGLLCIETPVD